MLRQGLTHLKATQSQNTKVEVRSADGLGVEEALSRITASRCLEPLEQAAGMVWGAVGSLLAPVKIGPRQLLL